MTAPFKSISREQYYRSKAQSIVSGGELMGIGSAPPVGHYNPKYDMVDKQHAGALIQASHEQSQRAATAFKNQAFIRRF